VKVAKYRGANLRDALAQAKRDLGEHAIILSTRELRKGVVGGGIEITAVVELGEGPVPMGVASPAPAPRAAQPAALAEEDVERIMGPLRSELRALRSLLRASPGEGTHLRQELGEFKRALSDFAAGSAAHPAVAPAPAVASASAPMTSLEELARGARLTAPSTGRVVALIGPTGAGKTTTVAKLGARAALVRGLAVGFITLDDYRVGGEEQLRIFAELIPAPLHVASNRLELSRALRALETCDVIYVDTSGRSPRDRQALAELASTLSAIDGLEIHLVLPAPSAPAYLDSLVARYRATLAIDRLLFTKLDEADHLDQLVRAPVRLGLPISFVTMGQAVPEDLEDADDAGLLARAESHDHAAGHHRGEARAA